MRSIWDTVRLYLEAALNGEKARAALDETRLRRGDLSS